MGEDHASTLSLTRSQVSGVVLKPIQPNQVTIARVMLRIARPTRNTAAIKMPGKKSGNHKASADEDRRNQDGGEVWPMTQHQAFTMATPSRLISGSQPSWLMFGPPMSREPFGTWAMN